MIWIQWVVMYLTDDDLVAVLKRFQSALTDVGVICLKENMLLETDRRGFALDEVCLCESLAAACDVFCCFFSQEDASVTRTTKHFEVSVRTMF
jgi:hypothetical protein